MVYLLHFDPSITHIRHYAGATRSRAVIAAIARGEASLITDPLVVAARERGVKVTIVRTWPTMYASVDELPHRRNRAKLCPMCLAADRERRQQ